MNYFLWHPIKISLKTKTFSAHSKNEHLKDIDDISELACNKFFVTQVTKYSIRQPNYAQKEKASAFIPPNENPRF